MTKVAAESDDSLYEGDWLTIRAMRKQNGTLPAAEWLDGLQGKHQVKFQVAAKQVEVDLRDKRPSDRIEVVPQSSERLVEFRITRPGASAPHLRMLGLREGPDALDGPRIQEANEPAQEERHQEGRQCGKGMARQRRAGITMSDRYKELLRDPELRREFERESLYESAVSDIEGVMKSRGLSQAELAKRLGVSPGRISQLLSGRRNLTLKTLADMSWALGLKVNLELDVIDDLESTPAKDDRPLMPEWLDRRKVQIARAVSQEKVKVFISYSSAVSHAATHMLAGSDRQVSPRRVRQFDPHGDRSSIAA